MKRRRWKRSATLFQLVLILTWVFTRRKKNLIKSTLTTSFPKGNKSSLKKSVLYRKRRSQIQFSLQMFRGKFVIFTKKRSFLCFTTRYLFTLVNMFSLLCKIRFFFSSHQNSIAVWNWTAFQFGVERHFSLELNRNSFWVWAASLLSNIFLLIGSFLSEFLLSQ